jgi:deazaflavin-dependent oxidoreductase (nitroreductase family)
VPIKRAGKGRPSGYAPGVLDPIRERNPFINSPTGARVLSALQLPLFVMRAPPNYGLLKTTGRRTGKRRSRCVRAVRRGDRAYIVAIKGKGGLTGWARNALAKEEVGLRTREGEFRGRARRLTPEERREAREAYCEHVGRFERLEYRNWRRGRPTEEKIRELHGLWFDTGTPLVIELEPL